jgi:hypothetical protein
MTQGCPPRSATVPAATQTNRGRGLLAHGTGRSAIYELGRRLDARADATEPHGTLNLSGYAAATTSA